MNKSVGGYGSIRETVDQVDKQTSMNQRVSGPLRSLIVEYGNVPGTFLFVSYKRRHLRETEIFYNVQKLYSHNQCSLLFGECSA